ncbi:DNA polymerase III subunit delta [Abyssibius alkaniclasticus]|uniref:DNA polymerase III subunit delta n=1 Tax=Abyssibius alkaniclasticus TaxID=2881234 RepID=UPI004059FCFA
MKADARSAARFFEKPDLSRAAVLIYGQDAMRVALKRQALVARLIGPEGEAEMRLTRLSASAVRADPATLADSLAAQGFFGGQRVVLLEDANDASAKPIESALQGWRQGDAMLVITAGKLGTGAKGLRKLIESHQAALAIAIYDDPPSAEEIDRQLAAAGIANLANDARQDLHVLGSSLDPGDFAQLVEKLSLYTRGQAEPVSVADIAAVAPVSTEAQSDAAIELLAAGKAAELAPQLTRLDAQGISPVSLVLAAQRYFRLLHAAATHSGGPDAALASVRPPVFGPRRNRFMGYLRGWHPERLEAALKTLTDTDLALRSSRPIPAHAMLERAFVRIAMLRQNS